MGWAAATVTGARRSLSLAECFREKWLLFVRIDHRENVTVFATTSF
jgi:hypothetical protein